MDKLGPTFQKRLKQLGIQKQVEAAVVCDEFVKAVNLLYDGEIVQEIKPLSFKNNRLTIMVSSSALSSELSFNKEKIICYLRDSCGLKKIELYIKVSNNLENSR